MHLTAVSKWSNMHRKLAGVTQEVPANQCALSVVFINYLNTKYLIL